MIKTDVWEEQCMTVEFVSELSNIRDDILYMSDLYVETVQAIVF